MSLILILYSLLPSTPALANTSTYRIPMVTTTPSYLLYKIRSELQSVISVLETNPNGFQNPEKYVKKVRFIKDNLHKLSKRENKDKKIIQSYLKSYGTYLEFYNLSLKKDKILLPKSQGGLGLPPTHDNISDIHDEACIILREWGELKVIPAETGPNAANYSKYRSVYNEITSLYSEHSDKYKKIIDKAEPMKRTCDKSLVNMVKTEVAKLNCKKCNTEAKLYTDDFMKTYVEVSTTKEFENATKYSNTLDKKYIRVMKPIVVNSPTRLSQNTYLTIDAKGQLFLNNTLEFNRSLNNYGHMQTNSNIHGHFLDSYGTFKVNGSNLDNKITSLNATFRNYGKATFNGHLITYFIINKSSLTNNAILKTGFMLHNDAYVYNNNTMHIGTYLYNHSRFVNNADLYISNRNNGEHKYCTTTPNQEPSFVNTANGKYHTSW